MFAWRSRGWRGKVEQWISSPCRGGGPNLTTSLAGVVHKHDLHQQVPRRSVDDAVDGPQQRAPRLVMEDDDDAGVGQVVRVDLGLAAENKAVKQNVLI